MSARKSSLLFSVSEKAREVRGSDTPAEMDRLLEEVETAFAGGDPRNPMRSLSGGPLIAIGARHAWSGDLRRVSIVVLGEAIDAGWSAPVQPTAAEIEHRRLENERAESERTAREATERRAKVLAGALAEIAADPAAAILELQIKLGFRDADGRRTEVRS